MKKLMLLFVCLGVFTSLRAQTVITGKIYDKQTKEPLIGATIAVPGTTTGAVTDITGSFKLNIAGNPDSLRISFIGYKSIMVKTQPKLNIALEASSVSINQVVISANRQNEARTDAPLAITTISKSDINDTKPTQLDQLLNQSPGVYMVDLANEQHAMSIRQPLGYNNYFLYMEDGIPIRTTGDFNHNALIEINEEAMDRIEIIKGPASSLYGSEAVGGAVNFITQAPSLIPTAGIEAELGSFGYRRANFFASTTIKNKLGLYIGGYYAGRSVGDSLYDNFHKVALNFRADYTINLRTKLTVTAAYINYYTDQKGGLDSAQFFNKNYVNDPLSNQRFTYRKVDAFRARATLLHNWDSTNTTNFTIYYRNNSVGQNPFYYETYPYEGASTGQINVDAFTSYGAIIQHTKKFKWLKAQWISGISADYSPETYNAQFIKINVSPQGVYYDYTPTDSALTNYNANLYTTAAYTQFELNPVQHLKVVASLRYDRLDYNFTNHLTPSAFTGPADTINHFDHLTPHIGLTYDFGHDRGLYANYSVGFAPPNITDLYSGFTVPNLQPSTFYNYEIGGWYGIGKKGYVEASVYRLNGVDEIISVTQANGTSLEENTGKTSHTGVELSLNYDPVKDVALRIGGTYAQHKYVDFIDGSDNNFNCAGKYMADAPPFILNSEITYKPRFLKGLLISVEWQGLSGYYANPENTPRYKYNGFNTFNARVGYTIKHFEIWANCLNFTDKVFATIVTYGYGQNTYYPGMLRTFNVGVGYTFGK